MAEPEFISREVLAELHAESVRLFGGTLGVRDEDGLLSALGAPLNAWFYGGGDLDDVAAAYTISTVGLPESAMSAEGAPSVSPGLRGTSYPGVLDSNTAQP